MWPRPQPVPDRLCGIGRRCGWRSPWHRRGAWAGGGWRRLDVAGNRSAQQTRPQRLARLEAVLFLAREPLSSRKLAQMANLADGTEARTLVQRLRQRYDGRGSGFQIEEIAGGFQILTRPKFGRWLRRLCPSPIEVQLSTPALETLVVVAYCQPALRADVEAVRGVQCGEILRQLMERELVRIVGRSEELGRPFIYGTTRRFLQAFGLRSLDELPQAGRVRVRPAGEHRSAVANDLTESNDIDPKQTVTSQTEEVCQVLNQQKAHWVVGDVPTEEQQTAMLDKVQNEAEEEEEEYEDGDQDEEQYEDDEDEDEEGEDEEGEDEEGEDDDEDEWEVVDDEEDDEEDDEDEDEDEDDEWEIVEDDEEEDEDDWDEEEEEDEGDEEEDDE